MRMPTPRDNDGYDPEWDRDKYEQDREDNAVAEYEVEEGEANSGMSWEALERLAAMRRVPECSCPVVPLAGPIPPASCECPVHGDAVAEFETELIGVEGEFHIAVHASPAEIELARVCAVSRERRAWQLMQEAEKHLVRCVEHWNNAQTELFSYGPKN